MYNYDTHTNLVKKSQLIRANVCSQCLLGPRFPDRCHQQKKASLIVSEIQGLYQN